MGTNSIGIVGLENNSICQRLYILSAGASIKKREPKSDLEMNSTRLSILPNLRDGLVRVMCVLYIMDENHASFPVRSVLRGL